jgi:hypothetical protein
MAKAFKIAAIVSTVLFVLSPALFVAGWHFDAQMTQEHSIHVKDEFNIGLIHRGDFNTALAFYGDAGPYNGGILALTSKGSPSPFDIEQGFDAPGIYYRYFKFRIVHPGEVIWIFRISLWYALVAFLILPQIWSVKAFKNNRRATKNS